MDGATSIEEMAKKLDEEASRLRSLASRGWCLDRNLLGNDDDYFQLTRVRFRDFDER